ncbi:hypothetical protein SARC_07238 [Sphaeroforma arctica JP610]|uniref:Band 7 domain-containing protein n=1 Tax=Sphaeroforma arctica JP610 TaxID=667725 RepID=A0A0L0FU69_9EUKA|nr:hypothetical protein SARC_07238 [Sphaeroforma arctica JP610]KNC80395.1 hypothetical protein SARC_07238 [Sphaeroforma arctica JP610]|eukprot:XP_014154297.1 hypothetical protein SARC_07238 [Sphaeroforma arctica JP610]
MCFCCFPLEHPLGCGFRKVGPNEALVVTGVCHDPSTIWSSAKVFVWPLQEAARLDKNTFTVRVLSVEVYSLHGVPVTVSAYAQCKVSTERVRVAAQCLLSKTQAEIEQLVVDTLEGHQRGFISSLSVKELISDKNKMEQAVRDTAEVDLLNFGIEIISYTIKDIDDNNGFLLLLGDARTAQVKAFARMGEADSTAATRIKQYRDRVPKAAAHYLQAVAEVKGERDLGLRECYNVKSVSTQQAEADAAPLRQAALRGQDIMEANMQTKIREMQQQTAVWANEVQRMDRQLDSTVKQPARAERDRVINDATARRNEHISQEQGKAVAIETRATAEAFSHQQQEEAGAEQLKEKARVFELYGPAATANMVLDVVPQAVAEVSSQLEQVERINIVGSHPSVGAIPREVSRVVAQVPKLIDQLTDLHVTEYISNSIKDNHNLADQETRQTRVRTNFSTSTGDR